MWFAQLLNGSQVREEENWKQSSCHLVFDLLMTPSSGLWKAGRRALYSRKQSWRSQWWQSRRSHPLSSHSKTTIHEQKQLWESLGVLPRNLHNTVEQQQKLRITTQKGQGGHFHFTCLIPSCRLAFLTAKRETPLLGKGERWTSSFPSLLGHYGKDLHWFYSSQRPAKRRCIKTARNKEEGLRLPLWVTQRELQWFPVTSSTEGPVTFTTEETNNQQRGRRTPCRFPCFPHIHRYSHPQTAAAWVPLHSFLTPLPLQGLPVAGSQAAHLQPFGLTNVFTAVHMS